jgi:hypothetical protein
MTANSSAFLSNLLCTVARLLLCFWVGGAVLFVITSVAEQRYPTFDSRIRDQLATIRFPIYYQFCWLTMGVALAATIAAFLTDTHPRRKQFAISATITAISLMIAAADYTLIYLPLQKLITPPGQTRSEQFTQLHNRSRYANQTHLGIALISAVVLCTPIRKDDKTTDSNATTHQS